MHEKYRKRTMQGLDRRLFAAGAAADDRVSRKAYTYNAVCGCGG